jgi:hypothetical protein
MHETTFGPPESQPRIKRQLGILSLAITIQKSFYDLSMANHGHATAAAMRDLGENIRLFLEADVWSCQAMVHMSTASAERKADLRVRSARGALLLILGLGRG